jgi:large subunit ribosomal protein L22
MIARASLRHLGVSPQKTRLVLDQIRNRKVEDALATLRNHRRGVAKPLEKLLRSAVSNASAGEQRIDPDQLYVSRAFADTGPSLKRSRQRAMGRVFRILKRSCHVTLELETTDRSRLSQGGAKS